MNTWNDVIQRLEKKKAYKVTFENMTFAYASIHGACFLLAWRWPTDKIVLRYSTKPSYQKTIEDERIISFEYFDIYHLVHPIPSKTLRNWGTILNTFTFQKPYSSFHLILKLRMVVISLRLLTAIMHSTTIIAEVQLALLFFSLLSTTRPKLSLVSDAWGNPARVRYRYP